MGTCDYKLEVIDGQGRSTLSGPVTVSVFGIGGDDPDADRGLECGLEGQSDGLDLGSAWLLLTIASSGSPAASNDI